MKPIGPRTLASKLLAKFSGEMVSKGRKSTTAALLTRMSMPGTLKAERVSFTTRGPDDGERISAFMAMARDPRALISETVFSAPAGLETYVMAI